MAPTHRRPREVDTSRHFCPHSDCDYRGWLGLGNLRANGHPSGGPWRQFHCPSCQGYFPETHGTIFHGKQAAVELIVQILACVAEGLGIRATARVFEVDANTVLHWLVAAAEQLRAFSAYFLCDLHVEQLQLDELYAVLRDLKAGKISDDEATRRLERSPYWVWTAMDPTSKLLVVVDVSDPELEEHLRLIEAVLGRLGAAALPRFVVFNKSDRLDTARPAEELARLAGGHSYLAASAHDPLAVEGVRDTILAAARARNAVREVFVPYDQGELSGRIYAQCRVLRTHATPRGTQFLIEGAPSIVEQLARACRRRTP